MIRKEKKKNAIKIINQGTYGCIFRPGLTCEGMVDDSPKEVTKVQRKEETSDNEIEIGKKLMNIKSYASYFAPIVESCEVDISNIIDDEFRKCEFIKRKEDSMVKSQSSNNELNFEINKITYVGKETLSSYYYKSFTKKDPVEFIRQFINGYKILMKGAKKMGDIDIVHYDIKENNIMCRQTGRPIYIDFGLSFDMSELSLEDNSYFDKFYIFEPSYSPWCMDINLINYAVNEIGEKMETMKEILTLPVSNYQIGEFMKIYFEKQTTLAELLSDEELKLMKENMMNYFLEMEKSSGGISKLRWKQVIGELSKYYKSWDVYSVSICYLSLIKSLNLEMLVKEAPFILEFTKLLKKIIVSSPDKRADAGSVIGELKKIKTISKEEMENLATSIKKKRENQEEMLMMKNIYIDSKQKYDLEKLKNQEE
jgi:serine/threonine protein kinase